MDERIERFVERICAVQHMPSAVEQACAGEWQAIDQQYRTDNSRRVRVSAYRSAMKQAGLSKDVWSALQMPRERSVQVNASYATNVRARGTHQQPIADYQALIQQALTCIESRSYSVMLPGLALLCGRRPAELCVVGDFCEDDELPLGMVWFQGQAKARDEERATTPYAIPLLCEVPRFMEAWTRFLTLKDFSEYAPRQPGDVVSPRFKNFGAIFGEAYTRYFASLMPANTTLRDLRGAYALIAYHTCRPVEPHVYIAFYCRNILGHHDGVGETAASYQKFYLPQFERPQGEY